MARAATLPVLNGESGLSRYLAEIRKFPMLEPQQEYMLAKRWREHDDRDAAHQLVTSHLRLVAKNDAAHQSLSAQFSDHGRTGEMRRGYLAFVWGVPNRQRGTIDAPIDRHAYAREKMAVRPGGREAVTHWEILESFKGMDGKGVAALLACELETGRTHQIRVHLAHIGHPLMGDSVYGPHFKTKSSHLGPQSQAALNALGRQALHAYLLAVEHPKTGAILEWKSDLPEDLAALRETLQAAQ